MTPQDVTKVRNEILEAALPHVAFDGWSWPLIERAAQEAGHDAVVAQAVFPGEITGVLDAFSDRADRLMLEKLAETDPEEMRIRDRVKTGVLTRLEILQPHKEAVRQSLSYWALPFRHVTAGRIVWRTADKIWSWAGDAATDYNHYTKRGLLSGVIGATTLAWLDDLDVNMASTKAFLDRRIENVMKLGKIVGKVKKRA